MLMDAPNRAVEAAQNIAHLDVLVDAKDKLFDQFFELFFHLKLAIKINFILK